MDELKRIILETMSFSPDHPDFKLKASISSIDMKPYFVKDNFNSPQHVILSALHAPKDEEFLHIPSIKEYSNGGSSEINHALISQHYHSGLKTQINHISKFINNATPLPHETHVYSGVKGYDPKKLITRAGFLKTPAFTSTSLFPHIAAAHSNDNVDSYEDTKPVGINRHVIHFILPKGYKRGRYIRPVAFDDYKNEYEFLLDKDQKWKHVGHHEHSLAHAKRHIWSVVPHKE